MATRIYGSSDDLIEVEGDVRGESNVYNSGDDPVLIVCSDGTVLECRYGKAGLAIWGFYVVKSGSLFQRVVECTREEEDPYSDVVYFRDGLSFVYVATEWERVK